MPQSSILPVFISNFLWGRVEITKCPESNGIGGAHNKTTWDSHSSDYVEISRTPHPTTPGVEQVEYKIPELKRDLTPTGNLKSKVYQKTLYDPQVWPRPRLQRALKQALNNSYEANGNKILREWDGTTREGYPIHGYYNPSTNKITSFIFQ